MIVNVNTEPYKPPRVSIGMPVYNGEATICDALDSLLAQSFTDFELIISDNASTDGTEAICRDYAVKDTRIRYVRQAANLGAPTNFQVVLDESVGEYFMWAAADDIRSIDFVKENHAFLEANCDYVASVSPVRFRDDIFDEDRMGDRSLTDKNFDRRMLKFFKKWHANGRFYSLIRRRTLLRMSFRIHDYLGFDWMVVIHVLSQGKTKRISNGSIVLGKSGESNTTNVFAAYNKKSTLHFIFPFRDLFVDIHRNFPDAIKRQRIHLYLRWIALSYSALRLNIFFAARDSLLIGKQC